MNPSNEQAHCHIISDNARIPGNWTPEFERKWERLTDVEWVIYNYITRGVYTKCYVRPLSTSYATSGSKTKLTFEEQERKLSEILRTQAMQYEEVLRLEDPDHSEIMVDTLIVPSSTLPPDFPGVQPLSSLVTAIDTDYWKVQNTSESLQAEFSKFLSATTSLRFPSE